MALVNEHFLKLQSSYLFSDIAKKVNSFKVTHPKSKIIRMGIGDVTQPLAPAVIEAMHKAVDEMAHKETFHGYGPEQGYPFLIDAIIKNDYESLGIFIEPGEVFISDGAKSTTHAGETSRLGKAAEFDGYFLCSFDFVDGMGNIRILDICFISRVIHDDCIIIKGIIHPFLQLVFRQGRSCRVIGITKIDDVNESGM